MQRSIKEEPRSLSLKGALSILRLSHHDPDVFYKFKGVCILYNTTLYYLTPLSQAKFVCLPTTLLKTVLLSAGFVIRYSLTMVLMHLKKSRLIFYVSDDIYIPGF